MHLPNAHRTLIMGASMFSNRGVQFVACVLFCYISMHTCDVCMAVMVYYIFLYNPTPSCTYTYSHTHSRLRCYLLAHGTLATSCGHPRILAIYAQLCLTCCIRCPWKVPDSTWSSRALLFPLLMCMVGSHRLQCHTPALAVEQSLNLSVYAVCLHSIITILRPGSR